MSTIVGLEGVEPDHVVLTHPANWGPFRRGMFEEVLHLAGLGEFSMAAEPEAAAVHYASTRDLTPGDLVAVYDLGGGTFDATVLQKQDTGIAILTSEGVERLGGIDFDEAILTHVNVATAGALDGLDMSDPRTGSELARLRQECTRAKLRCRWTPSPRCRPSCPAAISTSRSRNEFEGMIRPPGIDAGGAGRHPAARGSRAVEELTAILLVGGSSRIPW